MGVSVDTLLFLNINDTHIILYTNTLKSKIKLVLALIKVVYFVLLILQSFLWIHN